MITILHDADAEETVQKQIIPLFPATEVRAVPFRTGNLPDLEGGSTVVTYLPDAAVREIIAAAADRDWRLGLLPHPRMRQARIGFGVAAKLEDAARDILSRDDEVQVDLLSCNEQIVLNAVVIGETFAAAPSSVAWKNALPQLRRFFSLLRVLRSLSPTRFTITTAKEKRVETAALGAIALEHGRSAVLSRRVLEDSSVTDGMVHMLIFAPQSALRMLWFLLTSLILPKIGTDRSLPSFVGHIKSESVHVASPAPFSVRIDDETQTVSELLLIVRQKGLMLIPGRHLEVETTDPEPKEVFRTQGLPTGDTLDALRGRPLPWIHRASPEEFRDLFQMLRENAQTSESYLILIVLSTLLATFGLFADSAPVIIGAMILAPLMAPIVAMGMGVLRTGESDLLWRSTRSFLIGVALAVGCTVVITWLTPLRTINSEIAARLNPTLLDMGIAVISGIAGAYAHARANIARSLAGVAIAVALVPPLAVCGIGIGWGDAAIFRGAGLLFLTNFAGMILAAAGTFLVLGFSPFKFSRRGLSMSLAAFLLVTALLIPGFNRMVDEHRIIRLLDGHHIQQVVIREIQIRRADPIHLSVLLITEESHEQIDLSEIKAAIEEKLKQPIRLEARIAMVR